MSGHEREEPYAVTVAAPRRRDARLFIVSLGFVSGAGFLGLHALATPGVMVGPNAGFEFATPKRLSALYLEQPARSATTVLSR